jgi:hypothetical protein
MIERPPASERLRSAGRSQCGRVVLGVALLVLTLSAVAYGAGSSLKLAGPRSNKLQTDFKYVISGVAAGAADFVVAWEQLYPRGGCASTYAAESTRAFLPATYAIALETASPVAQGRTFSLVARFHAVNRGEHGICAYAISLQTGDTYAHAGAWWTNG